MLPISGLCGEHAARSRKRQPGRRCLLITPLAELVSCNYILADAPQHLYFIKPPHGWKIATTLQSLRFHERLCARKRCDRSGRSGHRLQWLRLLTLCSCAAVAPSNDLHSAIATGPPNDRPATWNRHASSQLPIAKTFVCGEPHTRWYRLAKPFASHVGAVRNTFETKTNKKSCDRASARP